MPAAGGLNIRLSGNVPWQLEDVRLSRTHFNDIHEIARTGNHRTRETAEPTAHPCPFPLVIKALAGRCTRGLRHPVQPRRIVRQCRPIPEQVASDVTAGPGIRQPMDSAGMQREMQAVRMAMAATIRTALQTDVTVFMAE